MDKVRHIDNLVIGAGPAGSVFGYLALKAGLNCLLVDFATFPRDKICGGGLTPKAWRLLDKLIPGIQYEYHPVRHMRFQLDDGPSCEFESEFEIRMTSRKDFDYTLLQNYQQAGGELLQDAFLKFEQQADGRFLVTMRSGLQLTCNYLIAADGANSRVRRQMLGKPKDQMLFMEEYVPKQGVEEAFVFFTRRFIPGGFYKFSSIGHDIYGYRAPETNRETFRQILKEFNIPETKFMGANISLNTVQSPVPNVILIGDAGGFANKITGEGLYDAFKTAYNALRAIVEHKPFSETNRQVFRKMKAEEKASRFFFAPKGYKVLEFLLKHPRITKWIFDTKMKRETFRP